MVLKIGLGTLAGGKEEDVVINGTEGIFMVIDVLSSIWVPLQGRQGSRGCIPGSPGESGLVSRGSQGLRSPLESRRGSLGAP